MAARSILIVEDRPALARTYVGFLQDGPYYVRRVETGAQALLAIDDEPTAILLDLSLDDTSDFDVLLKIRERKSFTSVVVLVAHGSMMKAIDAMQAGADDFLVKPFTAERLKNTLDSSIENRSVLSTGETAQFYSCFISFSSNDQEFVERLHADLQGRGVSCWFAPHDLPIGMKILDGLDEAIRLREKVVLVLSESAIISDWVEDEVTTAFEEERRRKQTVLFPIRLDDAVMKANEAWASKLRARNICDFTKWRDQGAYKATFERVLHDLKSNS